MRSSFLLLFITLAAALEQKALEISKDVATGSYTLFPQNSRLLKMITTKANARIALVQLTAETTTVYRIKDDEQEWKEISQVGTKIEKLRQSDWNKDMIFFIGKKSETPHYYTQDGGAEIKAWTPPAKPNLIPFNNNPGTILKFHSTQPDWAIFIGSTGCDEDIHSEECFNRAYLTKTLTTDAPKWEQYLDYVEDCEFAYTEDFKQSPKQTIYCEAYATKSGSQVKMQGKHIAELVKSTNWFKEGTAEVEVNNVLDFSVSKTFMLAAESLTGGFIRTWISIDGDHFAEAKLGNSGEYTAKASFTVVGAVGNVWLGHTKTGDKASTLFLSNWNGTYYTKIQDGLVSSATGTLDMEKLAGLNGTAIANVYTDASNDQSTVYTKQTFDYGRTWRRVSIGGAACQGKDDKKCYLNILNYISRSVKNNNLAFQDIPGVLIVKGNVGEYLLQEESTLIKTWLSLDAGFTWQELFDSPYQHEFADHGSVALLISENSTTTEIRYSYAYGKDSNAFSSQKSFKLVDISTSADAGYRKFMVTGYTSDHALIIFKIDFAADIECKPSDLQSFSLANAIQNNCLMGGEVQVKRRSPNTKCSVGGAMTPNTPVIVKPCECQALDFECDYNYEKNAAGKCVLVSNSPDLSRCQKGEKTYTIPTGYKKIFGSVCKDGNDLSATQSRNCPGQGWGFWSWFFFLIGSGTGLGGLWYLYQRTQRNSTGRIQLPEMPDLGHTGNKVLRYVSAAGEMALDAVFFVYEWVREKIGSRSKVSLGGGSHSYSRVGTEEDVSALQNVLLDNYDEAEEEV